MTSAVYPGHKSFLHDALLQVIAECIFASCHLHNLNLQDQMSLDFKTKQEQKNLFHDREQVSSYKENKDRVLTKSSSN